MTIGKRLTALRIARGFKSQASLAAAADVSQTQISEIENGKVPSPRYGTLERIAKALDVPVTELSDDTAPQADESLSWFWKSRFASLKPSTLLELYNGLPPARVAWTVRQLCDGFSASDTARRLGLPESLVRSIADGRGQATGSLMDILVEKAEVPDKWLLRGETGPIDEHLTTILRHRDAGAWLMFVVRAIEHRIQPDLMEGQLDILLRAARQNEKPLS